MRRFSVDERRARLARRHFLAPDARAAGLRELAGGLVGVHATDPASVFLSARARLDKPAAQEVERALYDERTVIRMIGMRRTLFVLPLDLAAVVQAACTDAIASAQRRRYAKLIEEGGIARDGQAWLDEVGAAALETLEARGEAFASELSKDVPALREKLHFGAGKKWAGSQTMTTWVLFLLAAEGRIVRARPRGAWTSSQWSWVPAASWFREPLPRLEPEAARAELARRWLAAYGPATIADLKWWSGWSLTQTRAALAAIGVVEADLDGVPGVVLPDDGEAERSSAPWPAFLPALDSTVMGWKERAWYLGDHGPTLFDRSGNAGPTLWWNGRVVGGWAVRKEGQVAYRLLEDVGAEAAAAIQTEAAELTAWLGEANVISRFGTPLERELAG
ncbi:MAG TPA: winged helix DNA-binding domain-containing protein [Gaiellaceae bacterium]|nr:winged helix DNA-binding domain-containing protein [Gaiellaceae bacterium]